MKKTILSLITVCAIGFIAVSCSDDDKPVQTKQSLLVGKWNYMEELALDANGNVVSTYKEDNGVCPSDIFNFKSDGALQNTDYDFSTNTSECNGQTLNGKWNITGDTFKLALGSEEDSFEIKKLTDNVFEIQRPLTREEEEDYELNVVSLKFVFKK